MNFWKEKLEEIVFLILWVQGQRGNREHSSCAGTKLRMSLEELHLKSSRRGLSMAPTHLLPWEEQSLG